MSRPRHARAALPEHASRTRDAVFTAGARRAARRRARDAARADLFAAALDDRLHEPYRADDAPLLAEVRADLPPARSARPSPASGPTVIVWARTDTADACARRASQAASRTRRSCHCPISPKGAGRD